MITQINYFDIIGTIFKKLRNSHHQIHSVWKINIFVNKSDERPSIHPVSKSDVSTEKIFKTAKIFVTHFAN